MRLVAHARRPLAALGVLVGAVPLVVVPAVVVAEVAAVAVVPLPVSVLALAVLVALACLPQGLAPMTTRTMH